MTLYDDHRGRGPRGYARSDERILEDLHDRLTEDPRVDARGIELRVEGGEVTLSGTVTERAARHCAEDIAESVSGVRHVRNDLRVQRPDRDDRAAYAAATPVHIPGGEGGPERNASIRTHSGALTETGAATGHAAKSRL